jgi:hypothetical protein
MVHEPSEYYTGPTGRAKVLVGAIYHMIGLSSSKRVWRAVLVLAALLSASAPVWAQGALNACDLNADGVVNILDVQLAINMYLGLISCTANVNTLDVCNTEVVNAVVTAALGGTCVITTHSVALSWTASSSLSISGYNVYRSTASGGTYTKINTSLVVPTSYTDNSVQAGQTYFYVATAVDTSGIESVYSSPPQQAVIPTP